MAKREKTKIVSKKHLARQEREAIQMRYIKYGSAVLLAAVALLVGYALVNAYIIIPNQPVAVVNGEKISTDDYQSRVKFERYHIIDRIYSTASMMQTMGDDETIMQYLQSSLQQYQFQLQPEIHGPTVINTMIEDVLIRQEAENLGIPISDTDVDAYIEKMFGYSPESSANTEPPGLDNTAPTPTAYTEDAFRKDYQNVLDKYQQTIGLSEAQFRTIVASLALRDKVFDKITKDVPNEEEQIWARHILVETEEEAQDVLARLESGEDFAALAQEVSTDTGTAGDGGDLGWFGHGKMVPEFEDAAFALEPGEISQPVETSYGYHIIQVMDKGIRPMDNTAYQQKKQTFFSDWLSALRDAADIEENGYWKEVYPEIPPSPTGN